jgi:hypothetical protein
VHKACFNCRSEQQARDRAPVFFALLLLAIASLLIACGGRSGTSTMAGSTTSGTATLAWDAVTDPNLQGYRVYYGTAPATYSQFFGLGLDVGNVTTYTVTGLNSTTRYYFAVTAFDTSNNESSYSNEVFKGIP